ncbi:hypothetical protein BDA99DRAFT_542335 [Phascolomyces articulosus]|uniref:Protein ZIP4 homolog n=1 Tax=Phascolomyces articulosus TaxID=60185 RepID=A0AAD5K0C8_9FUNG|nr:hypothetical protein BDA99DRAFT_542335 [Phascolomyces articulosus]
MALVDAKENPSHILPLLKRILTKAEMIQELLDLSETDIEKLEQYGSDLWYNAINMNHLDPSLPAPFEVIATCIIKLASFFNDRLREIGYRMTRPAMESYTGSSYKFWIYQFEMANALGKAWTDSGNYDRAAAAFNDAENVCVHNAQLETLGPLVEMDKVMLQETRRGNWEYAKEKYTEAVDYCLSNRQIIGNENHIKNRFLCQIGISISQKMLNDSKPENCLELIAQIFSQLKFESCSEKFIKMVLETIAHATLNVNATSLAPLLETTLIELLQNIATTFSNIRSTKEYNLAKLGVLSKNEFFHKQGSDSSIILEIAYFEAMENFPLHSPSPWISYIETITDGLDIVLQRCRPANFDQDTDMDKDNNNSETISPPIIDIGKLYQIKLFILTEAVNHYYYPDSSAETSSTPSTTRITADVVESIGKSLNKTVTELFMDKNEINPMDFTVYQMILWRAADTFYENQDYDNALEWYKQTRTLSMPLFKGNKNGLVLARQLAQCYALGCQLDNALDCLSEAMEDCSEHCTAVDYLLKADIYIKKGDENNDDYNVLQVLLCMEKLQKSNGFTFDMNLGLASAVIKSSLSSKGKKVILHKIIEESVTFLTKAQDIEVLNSTRIIQILWILRWIVCTSNSTVLQNRNLGEEMAENIQEICEAINQASELICKSVAESTDDGPSTELQSLSEWFISAAWNLGLQCCEREMNYQGCQFLLSAGKVLIQLTGNSENMDDRERISLFMCIVARQLSGNGQVSDHQEIISIAQKLAMTSSNNYDDEEVVTSSPHSNTSELRPPSNKQEAFNGLLQIFQVEALVSLGRLEETIKIIENCCKAAFNLYHLSLCERIAESVLQSQHCSKQDALKVLECIISLYQKQYPEQGQQEDPASRPFIERFSKWNRLWVSTAMVGYPESELYYLVVVTWNEGITWFHANDNNRASAWCKLAFDLLSYFNDTNQRDTLKHKLTQAYNKMTCA